MRKRIYLFFLLAGLFICFNSANAQTVFWEETFDSNPGTWSLDQNWAISNGMLWLYWSPTITNYDLSAISPVISLPENVGDFVVDQHINVYSPVNEIMEISIISGEDNYVLWSYEITNGNWGAETGSDLNLSLVDYAGQDIQIKLRSYGASTYNFNWWNIFDVSITALFDNDMTAMNVTGPTFIENNQPGTWTVTVKNSGLLPQDNYTVKLFKHGGWEIGSVQATTLLETYETISFDFNWTPTDIENTGLFGLVLLDGDEFEDNNSSRYNYLRVHSGVPITTLILDTDNNSHYSHPDTGASLDCEESIKEALDINGIPYDYVTNLPDDLSAYDIVFVELGLYCVG